MKRGEILLIVFVLLFVCSAYAHIFYSVHSIKRTFEPVPIVGKSAQVGTVGLTINNPPVLIMDIPDWEWYQGGGIENAFDLDDYFFDPDNDTLTYSYSIVRNVRVTIDDNNIVSFSTSHIAWWYGTDYVVFTASDGLYSTNSNTVKLTIKQIPPTRPPSAGGGGVRVPPCIENWICYEWGKCRPEGKQYRSCIDLNNCGTELNKPITVRNCTYIPTCTDNIQNQDETDIDCGGTICPKCALGKKCKVDDDCISGYCDPKTKRCALKPRLPVEFPTVPKIEKPVPIFALFAKYFLWILLVLIAVVLAERLYKKFIAPRIAAWRKKRILAIARKMKMLRLFEAEAMKTLRNIDSMVSKNIFGTKEGVEKLSRVVKEFLMKTLKLPKEFDYELLCKMLNRRKVSISIYNSVTKYFKLSEELLFRKRKITKKEFKNFLKNSRKIIKLIGKYEKKETEMKKRGLFKAFFELILTKKTAIVAILIALILAVLFFISSCFIMPLFSGMAVYTIGTKPNITNDGNLSETICIEDSTCTYDFSADVIHPNPDDLVYTYEAGIDLPTGFSMDSNTGIVTIFFDNDNGAGYWVVGLIATDTTDDQKEVGSKPFNLTARNDEPVISLDYMHCVENNTCYVDVSSHTSDEENNQPFTNYTDDTDLFNITNEGIINFTPSFEDWGIYNVNITCVDSENASGSKIVVFNITPLNTNPVLDYVCDNERNATYNSSFSCLINASDRENNTLTFSANESWFLINNSYGSWSEAMANFTPGKEAVGNWSINITVSDGNGGYDSEIINFTVFNINSYPNITDPQNLTAKQGFNFYYEINVTDLDMYTKYGENLTFYDNSTLFNITKNCQPYICFGIINFLPDLSFNGTENINFTVCDDENACDTSLFNITSLPNSPLFIENISPYGLPYSNQTEFTFAPKTEFPENITYINLSENESYIFNVTINEPDNDTVYYYWYKNNSLLSNDSSITRTYGWYDAGSENITLYASDGPGIGSQNGWEDNFTWVVTIQNKNRAPIFGVITHDTLTDFSGGTTNNTDIMTLSGKIILESNGTCYASNGTYISKVIDTGTPAKDIDMCDDCVKWINLSWNASLPDNTSIALQTRTSTNGTTFTNWSSEYSENNTQITSPAGRYFQYKVTMNSTSCNATPELDSITINYGINDLEISQGSTVYDWIDLDYFFQDYDTDDTLVFNYSAPSELNITIDSNHVVDLVPDVDAYGEKKVIFSLYDGTNTTASNEITINIVQMQAQQVIVRGGGGSTRIVTRNVTQLEHIKILKAGQVVAKQGFFEVPIFVSNPSNSTLTDILLESQSTLSGTTLSFSKNYFEMLLPYEEIKITLTIKPPRLDKEFDVNVVAKATSPKAEDEVVISLTALQTNRSVNYVRDLLSANPECLELNEMIEEAVREMAKGNIEEGQRILDSVIESCRYLISKKEEIKEAPSVITISRTWIERNIIIIASVAGIFALLLGLFYFAYRKA